MLIPQYNFITHSLPAAYFSLIVSSSSHYMHLHKVFTVTQTVNAVSTG